MRLIVALIILVLVKLNGKHCFGLSVSRMRVKGGSSTLPKSHYQLHLSMNEKAELEQFDQLQFNQFVANQVGTWVGVHAYYDPNDPQVADYMYCQTIMEEQNSEISHVSGFVAGEIRTDCETCYDSERLRTREVARYSAGKLRSRVCGTAELLGPFPTKRGLSYEMTLREDLDKNKSVCRNGDGRIRVLLGMVLVDIDANDANPLPSMILKDVVVVRERLGKRPLDIDNDPDPMWEQPSLSLYDGNFAITRKRSTLDGTLMSQDLGIGKLEKLIGSDSNIVHREKVSQSDGWSPTGAAPAKKPGGVDASDNEMFRRVYPGGILIEAPWVVTSTVPTKARVSWIHSGGESGEMRRVLAAGVDFEPIIDGSIQTGAMRVLPPKVTAFYVDNAIACA